MMEEKKEISFADLRLDLEPEECTFGALVDAVCGLSALKKYEIAEEIGVDQSTISRWVGNKGAKPSVQEVHRLCDVLNIDKDLRWIMLDAASKYALSKFLDRLESIPDDMSSKQINIYINRAVKAPAWKALAGGGSLFGALVNNIRCDAGISRIELARKMGVVPSTINKWENGEPIAFDKGEHGEYTPNSKLLNRLCDALDIGEDDIRRNLLFEAAASRTLDKERYKR